MNRRMILSLVLAGGLAALAQPTLARDAGERPRREDKPKKVEAPKPEKHKGAKHHDDGANHR